MAHVFMRNVWVEHVIGNVFMGKYTRRWTDLDSHHIEGLYQYELSDSEAKMIFWQELNCMGVFV